MNSAFFIAFSFFKKEGLPLLVVNSLKPPPSKFGGGDTKGVEPWLGMA